MNWRIVAPILAMVVCGCAPKAQPAAPRTQTAAQSNEKDPCHWLSPLEAGQILGQRVLRSTSPSPAYCRYAAPAVAGQNTALTMSFTVDDDVASYDNFISREDAAAIAGLGDRAVWNTSGNSVIVVKGKRRLLVSVADDKTPSALSESELQQRAVAAAQKIIERM